MIIAREDIQERIEEAIGEKLDPSTGFHCGISGIAGTVSGKRYFIKCGAPSKAFTAEERGLRELSAAGEIKTVIPIAASDDFIVTEYLDGGGLPDDFFRKFGRQLARLHRHTSPEFGFSEDNFIGRTLQRNKAEADEKHNWPAFFYNKRLLEQYLLAKKNGYGERLRSAGFERLQKKIPKIFTDTKEPPALLHGDLWRGNFLCDTHGDPVLLDPAVYYGHREADIAMTKLFGGFAEDFYDAYDNEYPLSKGWRDRIDLYNLYHLLNHLNMFGRGYLMEAEAAISKYAR